MPITIMLCRVFKPTYEKIRLEYWWSTISQHVRKCCKECQACQRRKNSRQSTKTTDRSCTSGETVSETLYKLSRVQIHITISRRSDAQACSINYGLSHIFRVANTIVVPNKSTETVATTAIDRLISTCGIPEISHLDQGAEFENKAMNQLQHILEFKKTGTTPYRP